MFPDYLSLPYDYGIYLMDDPKEIPCYMCDLVYWWCIVKDSAIFKLYETFLNPPAFKKL